MITLYYGFDKESKMRAIAGYGIPSEYGGYFYSEKERCEKEYPFMIGIDATDYPIKKIDEGLFVIPVNIECYDILQLFYNRPIDIRIINKPSVLFHATPIYHLPYIFRDWMIRKKDNFGSNHVFAYGEDKKLDCLNYVGGTGAILSISTNKYRIINAQNNQYGICDNISMDDVIEIDYYINRNIILSWKKIDICDKAKRIVDQYDYNRDCHNISYNNRYVEKMSNDEIFDFYNTWLIQ